MKRSATGIFFSGFVLSFLLLLSFAYAANWQNDGSYAAFTPIPCLNGQGALAPGQHYCSTTSSGSLQVTVNLKLYSDGQDTSTPLCGLNVHTISQDSTVQTSVSVTLNSLGYSFSPQASQVTVSDGSTIPFTGDSTGQATFTFGPIVDWTQPYTATVVVSGAGGCDNLAYFSFSKTYSSTVGLGVPQLTPSLPAMNTPFTISCPTNGFQEYNCIQAYANGQNNRCWTFAGWSGSIAQFTCGGLSAGTYTATCQAVAGTSSNCAADNKTNTYTVTASGASTTSTTSGSLTMTVYPGSVVADGKSASTITIQTSPSAQGVVIFIETDSNYITFTAPECTTKSDGSCSISITSTTSGTATITATANGYTSMTGSVIFTSTSSTISSTTSTSFTSVTSKAAPIQIKAGYNLVGTDAAVTLDSFKDCKLGYITLNSQGSQTKPFEGWTAGSKDKSGLQLTNVFSPYQGYLLWSDNDCTVQSYAPQPFTGLSLKAGLNLVWSPVQFTAQDFVNAHCYSTNNYYISLNGQGSVNTPFEGWAKGSQDKSGLYLTDKLVLGEGFLLWVDNDCKVSAGAHGGLS